LAKDIVRRGAWFLAGVILLAIVAWDNITRLDTRYIGYLPVWLQFGLFMTGVGCVAWAMRDGLSLFDWHTHRHEIRIVLAILVLGLFLRTVGLGAWMPVMVDELQPIGESNTLSNKPDHPILHPISYNIAPYSWLYAVQRQVFVTLLGNNFDGIRFLSALYGVASLVTVYGLARSLFDKRVALVALLVCATFPPHLHFSRLALLSIGDIVFGTSALMWLIIAFKTERAQFFAWAGLCLGMTQYFFEGGRIFYPLVMWLVALFAIAMCGYRLKFRHLLLLVGCALVVAMPLYLTWRAIDAPLFGRFNTSGIPLSYWLKLLLGEFDAQVFGIHIEMLARAFAIYVSYPDQSLFYNAPLIPLAFVPFFLWGVWRVRHVRQLPFMLILIPTFLSLLNGLLLTNSASFARYLAIFPLVSILLAVGIFAVNDWLWARMALPRQLTPQRLLWGMAGVIVLAQAVFYFVYLPHYVQFFRNARPYPDTEDALLRAHDLPADTLVHFIAPYDLDLGYWKNLNLYLNGDLEIVVPLSKNLTQDYFTQLDKTRRHAFFIMPDDTRAVFWTREAFPNLSDVQTSSQEIAPQKTFLLYTTF
jgi:hypothetical protein